MKKICVVALLIFSFGYSFSQQPLYRYYNGKLKKHYFTLDFNEYGNGGNGWTAEGVSCLVFPSAATRPGLIPVYRFYNAKSGDHYFNSGQYAPRRDLFGYTLEGPVWRIYQSPVPSAMPLFEYYNEKTGDHFYTVDKRELGPGFEGYRFGTVIGYAFHR